MAPYQPSQRYFVLDERRVRAGELKLHGLTLTVAQLEQSRSVADLAPVARRLTAQLAGTVEADVRGLAARAGTTAGLGDQPRQPTDDWVWRT